MSRLAHQVGRTRSSQLAFIKRHWVTVRISCHEQSLHFSATGRRLCSNRQSTAYSSTPSRSAPATSKIGVSDRSMSSSSRHRRLPLQQRSHVGTSSRPQTGALTLMLNSNVQYNLLRITTSHICVSTACKHCRTASTLQRIV